MKNTFIFFLFLFVGVIFYSSCSDDNSSNDKLPIDSGTWYYQSPHFAFDYAEDSVRIEMGSPNNTKAWAVKDIQQDFPTIAHEKMGAYFKGIKFLPDNKLSIRMQFADGKQDSLKASYSLSSDLLEVSLDAEDLERISGKKLDIPRISFNYSEEEEQLKLFFGKTYIQAIASMMMDTLLDMLLPSLIPAYPSMPDAVKTMIASAFKSQVNQILQNTRTLEIGLNLSRK